MLPPRHTHLIEKIASLFNTVASFTILLLMILIVCDVILRKLSGVSIPGGIELAEFMMIVLVFLSLAQAEVKDRNVKVSLIMDLVKPARQRRIAVLSDVVNAFLYAGLSAAAVSYAVSLKASAEVTMDLQIPKYPFVYIIAAGGALLSLVYTKKILSHPKDRPTTWTP